LQALYKLYASGGPKYRSDAGVFMLLEQIGFEFIESETDVNTFLRELKEEEDRIKEEMGSQ